MKKGRESGSRDIEPQRSARRGWALGAILGTLLAPAPFGFYWHPGAVPVSAHELSSPSETRVISLTEFCSMPNRNAWAVSDSTEEPPQAQAGAPSGAMIRCT